MKILEGGEVSRLMKLDNTGLRVRIRKQCRLEVEFLNPVLLSFPVAQLRTQRAMALKWRGRWLIDVG